MTILVTGAAGYLGRHVVEALSGKELLLLDYSNDLITIFPSHRCLKLDLLISNDLPEILSVNEVTAVVHLAALKSVSKSIDNPEKTISENLITTLNLLQASKYAHVKNFIFASSAAVYAAPVTKKPITENDELKPSNPYGVSKLMGEKLVESYIAEFNVSCLRFFNLIGSSSSLNMDRQGENFLPIALRAIDSGSPITIFGNTQNTEDGFSVRDFIDVRDAARAVVKTLDFGSSERFREALILNICSQSGTSLRSVLNLVESRLSTPLAIEYLASRMGEVPRIIGDSSLSRSLIDWTPEFTMKDSIYSDFDHFFNKL